MRRFTFGVPSAAVWAALGCACLVRPSPIAAQTESTTPAAGPSGTAGRPSGLPSKTGPLRPTAPTGSGAASTAARPAAATQGSSSPAGNGISAGPNSPAKSASATKTTPGAPSSGNPAAKSGTTPLPADLRQPVARPQANTIATPQAPAWVAQLTPEHEKYLDQVLNHWQVSSAEIKRYRCNFTRWEYDGVFVARDPKTGELPAKTQSRGVIKYSAPDKGMFKVDATLYYQAPQSEKDKPRYVPHPDDKGEQWICDGKSIYSFDHQKKQLLQTELPPDMQGKAIVDGPLPFMFGAEAAKIKQRFWVRVITPKDAKDEYWLEAVPKTRADAANFKMVHIIIDYKDYLPKAMAIFDRNYDPVRNPSCTNFVFEERMTNWNETLEKLNVFNREFWEPSTPLGYKKVVERYQPTADERVPQPANRPPAAGGTKQATRPTNTTRK